MHVFESHEAQRYMFGARSLDLFKKTQESLEGFGFLCSEETETVHGFELHTLVAVPPARPNRKERGCEL